MKTKALTPERQIKLSQKREKEIAKQKGTPTTPGTPLKHRVKSLLFMVMAHSLIS